MSALHGSARGSYRHETMKVISIRVSYTKKCLHPFMGRDLSLEGEDNGDDDQDEDYNKSAAKPYQVFFLFHANKTTDSFQIRTTGWPIYK